MKSIRNEFDRLIQVFRRVHSEKEKAAVKDGWQREVMRRIRNLDPLEHRVRFLEMFEDFIWRLSPAACVLLIALAVMLMLTDFTSDQEIFSLFLNNSDEISLGEILQL